MISVPRRQERQMPSAEGTITTRAFPNDQTFEVGETTALGHHPETFPVKSLKIAATRSGSVRIAPIPSKSQTQNLSNANRFSEAEIFRRIARSRVLTLQRTDVSAKLAT
jgi:hypothetical protein